MHSNGEGCAAPKLLPAIVELSVFIGLKVASSLKAEMNASSTFAFIELKNVCRLALHCRVIDSVDLNALEEMNAVSTWLPLQLRSN